MRVNMLRHAPSLREPNVSSRESFQRALEEHLRTLTHHTRAQVSALGGSQIEIIDEPSDRLRALHDAVVLRTLNMPRAQAVLAERLVRKYAGVAMQNIPGRNCDIESGRVEINDDLIDGEAMIFNISDILIIGSRVPGEPLCIVRDPKYMDRVSGSRVLQFPLRKRKIPDIGGTTAGQRCRTISLMEAIQDFSLPEMASGDSPAALVEATTPRELYRLLLDHLSYAFANGGLTWGYLRRLLEELHTFRREAVEDRGGMQSYVDHLIELVEYTCGGGDDKKIDPHARVPESAVAYIFREVFSA